MLINYGYFIGIFLIQNEFISEENVCESDSL